MLGEGWGRVEKTYGGEMLLSLLGYFLRYFYNVLRVLYVLIIDFFRLQQFCGVQYNTNRINFYQKLVPATVETFYHWKKRVEIFLLKLLWFEVIFISFDISKISCIIDLIKKHKKWMSCTGNHKILDNSIATLFRNNIFFSTQLIALFDSFGKTDCFSISRERSCNKQKMSVEVPGISSVCAKTDFLLQQFEGMNFLPCILGRMQTFIIY